MLSEIRHGLPSQRKRYPNKPTWWWPHTLGTTIGLSSSGSFQNRVFGAYKISALASPRPPVEPLINYGQWRKSRIKKGIYSMQIYFTQPPTLWLRAVHRSNLVCRPTSKRTSANSLLSPNCKDRPHTRGTWRERLIRLLTCRLS